MKFDVRHAGVAVLVVMVFGLAGPSRSSLAASPTAEQALKLTPIQEGVDCDRPTPEEAAKCKIFARKTDGHVGWVVEAPDGTILRRFLDTNGDNIVDQWSYYKDGVEVYRENDTTFTGKVDQYRWLNTAGTRWAVENMAKREPGSRPTGKNIAWRVISPEEVTAEVVAALAKQDVARFNRLLLTPEELQSLGLAKAKADALAAKLARAEDDFKALLAHPGAITRQSKWVQFGGTKPGVVPADGAGPSRDLSVYENVFAVVETGGKHSQVQIGTLVRIGDAWRLIDSPALAPEGQAEMPPTGFFFQVSLANRPAAAVAAGGDQTQKLMAELEKLDQFDPRRADLLEQIAESVKTAEERTMWYRQLADTISAAVQSGKAPEGDKRLESLFNKLQKSEADKPLAAYVRFRQLMAQYTLSQQAPKADFAKIQAEWLKTLEQFIAEYPAAPDTAEAMLQLGIAREFAGQEDEAKRWYGRIGQEFAASPAAKKALGAATRLDCVGKTLDLSGKSLAGEAVDLAKFRGKVVLVQYWATWCGQSKADIPALKELATKYGDSFTVLGVSLDTNPQDLQAYLTENKLPWPLIFESGGLDSRPANLLGIWTLPTMILVDKDGKVVSRNIALADVEAEVKKLVK